MKNIKLIAVDLDGPLLVDTFSPIMHIICERLGAPYTSELERNTFSRRREEVTEYLHEALKPYVPASDKKPTHEEMMQGYWTVREQYVKENKTGIKDGVPEFLGMLASQGAQLVCYGGLPEEYFRGELRKLASTFSSYLCTNDFRPGVKEIMDAYGVRPEQSLFIDDVGFVAEHAKEHGCAFIGVPASESFSWQRRSMEQLGVEYIVDSVRSIGPDMLQAIDEQAGRGLLWTLAGRGTLDAAGSPSASSHGA